MSEPLAAAIQPIVEQALNEVGAIQTYDAVMGQYATLPFMPNVKANLNSYVVEKGMEGIFHNLAIEEAAIRQDPAKRTTDILEKKCSGHSRRPLKTLGNKTGKGYPLTPASRS